MNAKKQDVMILLVPVNDHRVKRYWTHVKSSS